MRKSNDAKTNASSATGNAYLAADAGTGTKSLATVGGWPGTLRTLIAKKKPSASARKSTMRRVLLVEVHQKHPVDLGHQKVR